ncbi:MAG: cupin [Chloroflexi bacterium]|nr:cupin [Chloroflexota bacterium]
MKVGDHIDKPWGWEEILDLNDRYCIKHLFIEDGKRLSQQYHEHKTETLMLVAGAAEVTWGRGVNERVEAMVLSKPYPVMPGVVHRMRGTALQGALILEVSTTELDDVVRLDDDYGREGT